MQDGLEARIAATVAAMAEAADLYAVLRAGTRGLSPGEVAAFLPALRAALTGTEAGARMASVDQGFLGALVRAGAGLAPIPQAQELMARLRAARPAPVFLPTISEVDTIALPTTGERPDMPAFSDRAFDVWFASTGARWGIGLYGERRSVYTAAQFADAMSPERRCVHTGIDVFAPAGTAVYAPLAGRVAFVTYNADPLDYGHTLILDHGGFFTLYGHLGASLPGLCRVGEDVSAGQVVAHLGDWHENGGWAAHLHFQIMTDLLEQRSGNFWGVGHQSLWDVWRAICPDPNLILRLPEELFRV